MSDQVPLVSIITRTKDRNFLLRRTLSSVRNQTFSDWQVIIVNDGGNRELLELMLKDEFGDILGKIKTCHNETSKDRPAAANQGFKLAEGKYSVMLDDDDSWEPEFLEKCVKYLERSSLDCVRAAVTYSSVVTEKVKDEEVTFVKKKNYCDDFEGLVPLFRMLGKNLFPPCSFVLRTDVFMELEMFNEDFLMLEDWEFNIRFLQKYDIGVIPEYLSNYHKRIEADNELYENSPIDNNIKSHSYYRNMIQNRYLRYSLNNPHEKIGFYMNLSQELNYIKKPISIIVSMLQKLKILKK